MIEQHEDKSEAWLQWRNKGLGSSDSPVVMGVSKWQKPKELWEVKSGLVKKEFVTNFAIERGNMLEPIARRKFAAAYNLEHSTNETFDAFLCEMSELEYMRASLDGRSRCGRFIIEIKFQGKEPHEAAKRGIVPAYYYPQLQHGLLVSGAELCYFISINKEKEIVVVEVRPNEDYQATLVRQLSRFWSCVQRKVWDFYETVDTTNPPKSGSGVPELTKNIEPRPTDTSLLEVFGEWARLKSAIAELDEELKLVQDQIYEAANGKDLHMGRFSVKFIPVTGSVDYAKIPELQGVDLNKYRKPPTQRKQIHEDQKSNN
jgi:putative phage-type endonuclease